MARPSPRTLGVTTDDEGETVYFTKFGTQQLVKDPTSPTGVKQVNTGQGFKQFTTAPVTAFKNTFGFSPFGSPTPRNEIYPPMTITKGVGTTTPPAFPKGNGTGEEDCGWFGEKCWFPEPENGNGEPCDLGCLLTGRGCDCGCKDMKPCTTCDSDVCKECNAWDLQCEDCHKKNGTCTPPPEPKTTLFWVKIGLVIFALGVFLWLLRPLFSRGGSKPTGGFTITPA